MEVRSEFRTLLAGLSQSFLPAPCEIGQRAMGQGLTVRTFAARKPKMLICWLLASLVVGLVCLPGWSLDRDRSLRQMYHTAWTAKDGAPGEIGAIAQTTDGYLWLGAQRGLFQFDGVKFTRYVPPPGVRLPSSNIHALMATPDGGLLIAFNPSGVAFLKHGLITLFDEQDLDVSCFARDLDGRIWAGVWTEQAGETGLRLLENGRWVKIGADWHFSLQNVSNIFVDHTGTLWIDGEGSLEVLHRYSNAFQQVDTNFSNLSTMAEGKDGRIWLGRAPRGIAPINAAGKPLKVPRIAINNDREIFDRDGALWTYGRSSGLCRVRFPERLGNRLVDAKDPAVECMTAHDGLTDQKINGVIEDREGNIWAISNRGLDRFRSSHLVPVRLDPHINDVTLLPGDDGGVWIASESFNPVVRLRNDMSMIAAKAPSADQHHDQIVSVYRDLEGVVWWGAVGGLWRQQGDRFTFFPEPPELRYDAPWEIFPDTVSGKLWVRLGDDGLFRFKDGIWEKPDLSSWLPNPLMSASFVDAQDRTWLGYRGDHVSVIVSGKVRSYGASDGLDVGRIRSIRGQGGLMFFGGELGLATLKNDRFTTVRTPEDLPLGAVTGIVPTQDGALWLAAQPGVVRVSPADVAALARDPQHLVVPEVFGFYDGLVGTMQTEPRFSTAVQTTDGKLWFATTAGLAWIDPAHIERNSLRPPVFITALHSEKGSYSSTDSQVLPQRTTSLRFAFTALCLSIPEKVRFKYRLTGVDKDWQDGGTRREAIYNNLGPGHYIFRVIAANNDGVWNEDGATLHFDIAPAWFQTMWFRLLCVAALLAFLWALYQMRLRSLAHEFEVALDARVAERTRIAQDLHDTLLQGLISASMQLDIAHEQLPDVSPVKRIVAHVLTLMRSAVEEGRGAVGKLRVRSEVTNELVRALSVLPEEVKSEARARFRVLVKGQEYPLRSLASDEIYRISKEALVNAFRHSNADKIEIEINYGRRWLAIAVRDNGVGIDPAILEAGREGHFGLVGMRERARKIGARLTVRSRVKEGTEVELVIPRRSIVASPGKRSDWQG